MSKKYNIIEVVESTAISNNTIFNNNTIITFYNDTSKFKIADGKTPFNNLEYIGGSGEGTIETGSGLYIGVDNKLNLGLDATTIGTTLDGGLTEDLYLLKGSPVLGKYAVLSITDSQYTMGYADTTDYASKISITKGEGGTALIIGSNNAAQTQLASLIVDANIVSASASMVAGTGYIQINTNEGIFVNDINFSLGIQNFADYSTNIKLNPLALAQWGMVVDLHKSYAGYNATETQTLKHILGIPTWVTDV